MFLVALLLFWWQILAWARRSAPKQAAAILLLFLAMFPGAALGAIIFTAPDPIYPAYTGQTNYPWNMGPLVDQQIGGLMMLMGGNLAYLGVIIWLLLRVLKPASSKTEEVDPAWHKNFTGLQGYGANGGVD
jgi:cytochrome c oxidase assembly factor CtaG